MKKLVSISRQFGSGGREIAARLAKRLGVDYYDKNLIRLAAERSGISEDVAKEVDEKATSALFYTSPLSGYVWSNQVTPYQDVSFHDKLFLVQSDIIKEVAAKGEGVIVGRCGDYVMRDCNPINIFVHSSLKSRVERAVNVYGIPEKNAESAVLKIDKKRYAYYNYYTGEKWGAADNYHLCIDSGIGLDAAVETIYALLSNL